MKSHDEVLSYMINKRAKALADDMKIKILGKLIELSETRGGGVLLKQEMQVIKAGIEAQIDKEKQEDIKSIESVINNLVGVFGQEDDFEDKVTKKLEHDANCVEDVQ